MVLVDIFISSSNQPTGLVKEYPHGSHCSQEVPRVSGSSDSNIRQLVNVMVFHFRSEYC